MCGFDGLNLIFQGSHFFLAPRLTLEGIDFGGNACSGCYGSSNLPSYPSRGARNPRVHENMTVLWRRCSCFEVIEKCLFSTKHLNSTGWKPCKSHPTVSLDTQACCEQRSKKSRK